jgi:5-methylcytosine-specific restriction enzyme subunit McrC
VTQIELSELGPDAECRLTGEQGRRLARSGVVRAVPSPYDPQSWLIGPAGKVGAASIGDVEVRITPKLAIARLLFLVGYALHGVAWRLEDVALPEAPGLVPVMAQVLWRQTERAVHQGLLPGYVTLEETSYVLRGRLRETEQLYRHHGLPLPWRSATTSSPSTSPKTRSCEPPANGCCACPGWMPNPH